MSTTLLAIVTDAVNEIGALSVPSTVYGNSDRTIQRLVTLSNREGRDLVRAADWTVLQRLHTFATVASTNEYDLPADFARLLVRTEWDRSNYLPLMGPLSPQEWQSIKSGVLGAGVYGSRYRIYRSQSSTSRVFYIDPTPDTGGDTLAFEYISKKWCATMGGTPQSAWAADDDVTLLDRDLMTLGLIIRFKRATGLDYGSEVDEYTRLLDHLKATDRPSPDLSLIPVGSRLLSNWNLPETISLS